MSILRDTGATVDVICQKYVDRDGMKGEHVWVRHLLDDHMRWILNAIWGIEENCPSNVEKVNAVVTHSQTRQSTESNIFDESDQNEQIELNLEEGTENSENEEILPPVDCCSPINPVTQIKPSAFIAEQQKSKELAPIIEEQIKTICHDGTSSRLGVLKTKDWLLRHFFWPKCYKEIEDFVKTCDPCQRDGKTNDRKKAPLVIVPVISEVFSKINVDACFQLDGFSEGDSDRSRNILYEPLDCRIFLNRFGIKVSRSSVYHPQSNPVERFHRTVKRILKVLCIEAAPNWESQVPAALFALRTVTHESTGFSPAELVYGNNLRTPVTLLYESWLDPG
ncbi:retrovirus-related Pol polyprotein from transposon 297 [Trichonephila clavipes]|nr:retrovirus-related Pol polyprotein from transposon 297 [Trichonephila clavipes]